MKQNNTALLIIDAQNDFHDIPGAALGVPGAVKDTERTANFIAKVNPRTIFATQDSHYLLDIAHPTWFNDAKGNPVSPFTMIDPDDVRNGKYDPIIDPVRTLKYLDDLKANGEFTHTIWPPHCLIGTPGQAFHPVFFDALRDWMIKNKRWVVFIRKGENPYTEHFGAFRANVPIPEDPNTQVNQGIFKTINDHDDVFLGGQAKTHCDINTLRQMIQIAPQLASKIVVLEDLMSPVPGLPADFYTYVDSLYAEAKKAGVRFAKSTDI